MSYLLLDHTTCVKGFADVTSCCPGLAREKRAEGHRKTTNEPSAPSSMYTVMSRFFNLSSPCAIRDDCRETNLPA